MQMWRLGCGGWWLCSLSWLALGRWVVTLGCSGQLLAGCCGGLGWAVALACSGWHFAGGL